MLTRILLNKKKSTPDSVDKNIPKQDYSTPDSGDKNTIKQQEKNTRQFWQEYSYKKKSTSNSVE